MDMEIPGELRVGLETAFRNATATTSGRFFCVNMSAYAELLLRDKRVIEAIHKEATEQKRADDSRLEEAYDQLVQECSRIATRTAIEAKKLGLDLLPFAAPEHLKRPTKDEAAKLFENTSSYVTDAYKRSNEVAEKLKPLFFECNQWSSGEVTYSFKRPLSYGKFWDVEQQLQATRARKLYVQLETLEGYAAATTDLVRADVSDQEFYPFGAFVDAYMNVIKTDPHIENADQREDIGDGGDDETDWITWISPKGDRQELILFHEWLLGPEQDSPKSEEAACGDFKLLRDGSITYGERPVRLNPQQTKLMTAFIKKPGHVLDRSSIIETLWNEDDDTHSYLEEDHRTRQEINKRISNVVSILNDILRVYDRKSHIISMGRTSYKLIP